LGRHAYNLHEEDAAFVGASTSADWLGPAGGGTETEKA
jgi:hypothetical protein